VDRVYALSDIPREQALADARQQATGRAVPQRAAPRRPGDPAVLVADPARAKALLSWTPAMSDLDTIVATALKPRLSGFAGLGPRGKTRG